MSRRKQNTAAVTTDADDNTTPTTAQPVVADLNSDDAVEAALAALDAELSESHSPSEAVVIDINDQVLAEIEGDGEIVEEPIEEPEVQAASGLSIGDLTVVSGGEDEEPPVAEADEPLEDHDIDAVLAQVEAESEDSTPAAAPAATKPKRAPKAPAAPATPKRDFHTIAALDKPTLEANLNGCGAQKVIEKAQNLIQAIEVGKQLSRYTKVAVKTLVSDGKISGPGMVKKFEEVGLSTGTARAQAQQMTALFKIVGLAVPDVVSAKELVIADRALAHELMQLAA